MVFTIARITSLSIDTDGVVQARDIRGHKSLFYSFHTAPALDPVVGKGDDIFCTDVPSDDQVLWVAGLTGQTGLRVVVTPLVDQLDSPRISLPVAQTICIIATIVVTCSTHGPETGTVRLSRP